MRMTIDIIKNDLSPAEKRELVRQITEFLLEEMGRPGNGPTWVRFDEVHTADWGEPVYAAAGFHALAAGRAV
ncbi:MAG TPA: hypothetical protein VG942_06565 [Hyphomonadaceae bacterium]|nr:hypothetical protein [Hyphomonadaceae bacterium]